MVAGFVVGPVLVVNALHERDLNASVARAHLCPSASRESYCLTRQTGTVVSVIEPNPNPGYIGSENNPGAGNVEPRIVLRLVSGRTVALDVGFANVPRVGDKVSAFYYHGILLRASRSDGRVLAVRWVPTYWLLHLLTGAALIAIALLALTHRLRGKTHRVAASAFAELR